MIVKFLSLGLVRIKKTSSQALTVKTVLRIVSIHCDPLVQSDHDYGVCALVWLDPLSLCSGLVRIHWDSQALVVDSVCSEVVRINWHSQALVVDSVCSEVVRIH